MQKTSFMAKPCQGNGVHIEKMRETPFSKEIRICLSQGSVMKEHTAPGPITVMVLKGCVSISSLGESAALESGDMVDFGANVPHSLHADTDSMVRLSLSKHDSVKRVVSLL